VKANVALIGGQAAPPVNTTGTGGLATSLPRHGEAHDTSKLQAIAAKAPAGCGLKEVAPGVWVTLDCARSGDIATATPHLGARKLKALKGHRTRLLVGAVRATPMSGPAPGQPPPAAAGPAPGASTGDALPASVDLRAKGLDGPIKYQGTVGTCSAHSLSSVLDNALRRAGRSEAVSPTHVWSRYRHPAVDEAISLNRGKPLATTVTLPDSSRINCMLDERLSSSDFGCGEYYNVERGSWKKDPQVVAAINNADRNGLVTIDGLERLGWPGRVDVEEIMSVIASGVAPWAVFDFTYDGWRVSGKDATIKDYEGREYTHAVTLVAYRPAPSGGGRQFLIHNSWGQSWGDGGYAWISEYMVQKHMWAYRVKVAGLAPQELTDDDCGPDELIDSVTNRCAAICANDARPANGCR
jgi:hypothetical protein